MKVSTIAFGFLGAAACAGLLVAADMSKPGQEMTPEQKEMMEKCIEAGKPGAGHKAVEGMAGSWDFTVKMWMDPSAPPESSPGKSEIRWILGGRFLEQKVTGTSMGQPFEGIGLLGFDNVTQKYQSIWLDSMSTAMMTGTGSYDAASKTITETGTFSCPMQGKRCEYRAVTRLSDKDRFTYEFFTAGPDGKEMRMMEIQYVRAGKRN